MKQQWIRICIVWLLTALLPVQALAATLMLHCSTAAESSPVRQVHAHEPDMSDHHGHQGSPDGQFDQPVAAADDAGTDASAVKCSSCAPCGSCAAPQPSFFSVDSPVIVAIMRGHTVQAFRSADVFVPDRPPRTTFA